MNEWYNYFVPKLPTLEVPKIRILPTAENIYDTVTWTTQDFKNAVTYVKNMSDKEKEKYRNYLLSLPKQAIQSFFTKSLYGETYGTVINKLITNYTPDVLFKDKDIVKHAQLYKEYKLNNKKEIYDLVKKNHYFQEFYEEYIKKYKDAPIDQVAKIFINNIADKHDGIQYTEDELLDNYINQFEPNYKPEVWENKYLKDKDLMEKYLTDKDKLELRNNKEKAVAKEFEIYNKNKIKWEEYKKKYDSNITLANFIKQNETIEKIDNYEENTVENIVTNFTNHIDTAVKETKNINAKLNRCTANKNINEKLLKDFLQYQNQLASLYDVVLHLQQNYDFRTKGGRRTRKRKYNY